MQKQNHKTSTENELKIKSNLERDFSHQQNCFCIEDTLIITT